MKIVILTPEKQIYSPSIIKKLIPENEISGVFVSCLSGPKKNLIRNIRYVAEKAGWLYIFLRGLDVFHNFFLSIFDSYFQTIKSFCQKNKIPIYQLGSINSEQTIKKISEIKPDILISLFFNQILKKEIISLPKYGCLNVHRSLLPKYRGSCSAFWQMSNNERITGTTIHYIDEGADTGDILSQIKYPLLKNDTHHSLCLKNIEATNSVLRDILKKIETNQIQPVKQNGQPSVYPYPTRQATWNFIKKRKRMF